MQKNPAAVALGRLGGLKGGKARAKKLSSDERKAIAAFPKSCELRGTLSDQITQVSDEVNCGKGRRRGVRIQLTK